jgi:glycoprotein endo-alpha-1,2-mannosidase
VATATATAVATPTEAPAPSDKVTAFFYAWYGTPAGDAAWRHWNQRAHVPPEDIASSFYPERGPYSSRDPAVLDSQMAELVQARVGVIAVSWWGQGSWEDKSLDGIFAAAAAHGIKIAFHVEPYQGQTAASVKGDITYLLGRFGSSPALYRVSHPTAGSSSTAPRPVFYLFASSRLPVPDLTAVIRGLRGTPNDSIIMVHSPKASTAVKDGADGVYTYDSMAAPGDLASLVADCRADHVICSPSVSPGFDNSQAVSTGVLFQNRENGARYDSMWKAVIGASAEWASVTSFNEWHEGTQIEPATDHSGGSRTYTGYGGAYGISPADAPDAYLNRTAYWVGQFAPGN